MCVEDKLEESDTQCSGVREVNNEAQLSHKGPFFEDTYWAEV